MSEFKIILCNVWICMDCADDEDSINRICLSQENVFGKPVELTHLDKVVGVIIRIRKNDNAIESRNYLIGMLETLFRSEPVLMKKKKLAGKYGLIVSGEIERRLDNMCNVSDVLVEKAIEKGIEKGENRLNRLNIKLIENKRYDDLEKATRDQSYRTLLYKEFQLDEQLENKN